MTNWRPRLGGAARAAGTRGRPDRGARQPLYERIVDALAADVVSGRLAPGVRLPTQRELADQIGTTVATVTRAYAEAQRRGLVTATVGRGTFVRGQPSIAEPATTDLTVNFLTPAPFAGELGSALRALESPAVLDALWRYGPYEGQPRHREVGVAWLAQRGLQARAKEIVVTAGAQHGMLVALATLTRPGDTVLVEALTYPGMKSVANHLHVRLVPVAMDGEGLRPDALQEAIARTGARVLYAMPALHNPTGITMSGGRRRAILDIVSSSGLQVIEDDQYGFLTDVPPLTADAPDRGVYINSISKSLLPGLRVAFLRAPAALVPRIAAAVFATAVMAPPFAVELLARWIEEGTAARVLAWKRSEYAARAALARRIFAIDTPTPVAPHVWLPLREGTTAADFVEEARLRGVRVNGSSAFLVAPGAPPAAVRVCLGPPASRETLERALRILEAVRVAPPSAHAAVV
ncbi:MAG TPA: PLP-dependent aminotransferase family protein [Vicinamibacterales bacterium]